jgi:Ca2+-binding RTX toxin-like protein
MAGNNPKPNGSGKNQVQLLRPNPGAIEMVDSPKNAVVQGTDDSTLLSTIIPYVEKLEALAARTLKAFGFVGDPDTYVYRADDDVSDAEEDFAEAAWNAIAADGSIGDVVDLKDGNDLIWASGGNDIVFGGRGNDQLRGENGTDVLFGEDGNDVLRGGADNDFLAGGDGNDVLDGGTGDDYMHGGDGDDIFKVDSLGDTVVENVARVLAGKPPLTPVNAPPNPRQVRNAST